MNWEKNLFFFCSICLLNEIRTLNINSSHLKKIITCCPFKLSLEFKISLFSQTPFHVKTLTQCQVVNPKSEVTKEIRNKKIGIMVLKLCLKCEKVLNVPNVHSFHE